MSRPICVTKGRISASTRCRMIRNQTLREQLGKYRVKPLPETN